MLIMNKTCIPVERHKTLTTSFFKHLTNAPCSGDAWVSYGHSEYDILHYHYAKSALNVLAASFFATLLFI